MLAACKRFGVCKALPRCHSSCRAAARHDGPFPHPSMEKPAQSRFFHQSNTMTPSCSLGVFWGGAQEGVCHPAACTYAHVLGSCAGGNLVPLVRSRFAPRLGWMVGLGHSSACGGVRGAERVRVRWDKCWGQLVEEEKRSFPCRGTGSAGFAPASRWTSSPQPGWLWMGHQWGINSAAHQGCSMRMLLWGQARTLWLPWELVGSRWLPSCSPGSGEL